jgi:hypothetical protein
MLAMLLTCSGPARTGSLAAYLKAEKELRARIAPEHGLQDSIKLLRKKYDVDPKSEIARMKRDPDAWKRLMETLAGKK